MDSMGQRFKAAREKKRMPLSQAAAQTRIKLQYLELMEQDDFSRMPAPAYAKGFIRMYATFLNLDPVPLVQEYMDQHLGRKAKPAAASGPAKPKANLPWLIKKAAPSTPAPLPVEPAESAPEVEQEIRPANGPAAASSTTRAPAKLKRPPFKKPDVAALLRALAAWPWRQIGTVALVVIVVVGLVNGLARCARRADSPPALSRSVEFKRGVPAVLMEPPEPYLAVPAEPVEKAP